MNSGKTNFMSALWRLHTTQPGATFLIQSHYPAWLEKADRLRGDNLDEVVPISAVYKLTSEEIKEISERFGPVVTSDEVTFSRNFKGTPFYQVEVDQEKFVKHFLDSVEIPEDVQGVGELKDLKGT